MIKLIPATKNYIWGGNKLKKYGILGDEPLAEGWMLSMHKDGESCTFDGKPLSQVVTKKDWGENAQKFPMFPVLIKLIDAKDNLSVQVHPSDEYALKNENSFGKTEMWYVLEAESGAGLYVGMKETITKSEFESALNSGTLLEKLNFFPVKKGDCFFIEAGTVHAIGKGCVIAEVQQNSNLTYRLFDYNRVDALGSPRPLHIEKALKVSSLTKYEKTNASGDFLARSKYFIAERKTDNGRHRYAKSFASALVTGGTCALNGETAKMCDSFFFYPNEEIVIANASKDFEIIITTVE